MYREMQRPHQQQRINLSQMKAEMVKKLGPEGSRHYFFILNKFLSMKLSKVEFNKLCLRILGRDNISMHNQFIHGILANACGSSAPLVTNDKEVLKPLRGVEDKHYPDTLKQSVPNSSILFKGNTLPLSPRKKARTVVRDRKSTGSGNFGPNGKTNIFPDQSSTHLQSSSIVKENGVLTQHGSGRLSHHHQGLKEQTNGDKEVPKGLPTSSPGIKEISERSILAHSKHRVDEPVIEYREGVLARNLLDAPLGIPLCPASVGGGRKSTPLISGGGIFSSFSNFGGLLDTNTLKGRMEEIAATQGIEDVSVDSAKLLNSGLDVYLKGLIASCTELSRARSVCEPMNNRNQEDQVQLKLVNGVLPNCHYPMERNSTSVEGVQERIPHCPVSLLEFRVAMELNPQQLGEDWPIQLERICTHETEDKT